MPERSHARRFDHFLEAVAGIPDPLARLDAIRQARETLEELEARAVKEARHAGATWKGIGTLYGLSKQGAQQRFRSPSHQEAGPPGDPARRPPSGTPARAP